MKTLASEKPGIREQYLLSKMDNPLFGASHPSVGKDDLAQARLLDGMDRDRYLETFQTLVQRAADLEPNTPSETILELKEQLDRSYQQACALPGNMDSVKQAIIRLVDVIMQAVRDGAGNDLQAQQQLVEEELARKAHYQLQEIPLVAALMHPDSPVAADELIPALLGVKEDHLSAVVTLFDERQLASICHDAAAFLAQLDPEHSFADAWDRLRLIEAHYRQRQPSTH
jgi:hypothetical protein